MMAESGSSSKNFSGDNDSERFSIQTYQFEPRIDSDKADSIPEGGISGDESDIETTKPPTAKFRLVCQLNDREGFDLLS